MDVMDASDKHRRDNDVLKRDVILGLHFLNFEFWPAPFNSNPLVENFRERVPPAAEKSLSISTYTQKSYSKSDGHS